MQIPENFRSKVARTFGEKGSQWLAEFPDLFQRCAAKWGVTDIRFSDELSINLVCFVHAADYGEAVLKMGVPHTELFTGMKALALFDGRGTCRQYDSDDELGASLLERITPGHDLTTLPDDRRQLEIAADLIARLPIPITDTHGLPNYADWVKGTFLRVKRDYPVEPRMVALMDLAEEMFFQKIDVPGRPRMLLHGDLHHKNILQGQSGQWKVIDPQGVIGVPCMESARFIENHIDFQNQRTNYQMSRTEQLDYLANAGAVFADKLGETSETVATCLFILHVLSTAWGYEMNYTPERLATQIEDCQLFLENVRRLEK